jgi:gliding motility-associated-like protein
MLLGSSCEREGSDLASEFAVDPNFVPNTVYRKIATDRTNDVQCVYENNFTVVHIDSALVTDNSWYIIRDNEELLLSHSSSQLLTVDGNYVLKYRCSDGFQIVEKKLEFTVEYCPTGIAFTDIFSPNGDGQYEKWRVSAKGIERYNCAIKDLHENLVYVSTDETECWDGNFSGKEMPSGTYEYSVDGSFKNGTLFEYRGTLELIR